MGKSYGCVWEAWLAFNFHHRYWFSLCCWTNLKHPAEQWWIDFWDIWGLFWKRSQLFPIVGRQLDLHFRSAFIQRELFPENEIARDAEMVDIVYQNTLEQQVSSDPIIRTRIHLLRNIDCYPPFQCQQPWREWINIWGAATSVNPEIGSKEPLSRIEINK